ncbi:T9SS type A sorting domain-containing protein [bacterium]|nr:MAG: T9SS type A sorting domain-containing protein [bacterium]
MRKVTHLLAAALFFLAAITSGNQAQEQKAGNAPGWIDPDKNFRDVQKEFDQFWTGKDVSNRDVVKGTGFKQFKRYEWFWQSRVDASGKFNPELIWLARQEKMRNFPNSWFAKGKGLGKSSAIMVNSSNWTNLGPQTSIPSGGGAGRVNCIVFDPTNSNTIYVGSPGGGLWKTTNGGTTWTTNTDELGTLGVSSLAIDPTNTSIMYLGTGDGDAGDTYSLGVLKSIDGGATWNTTGLSWTASQTFRISKLIIHPTNTGILVAATSNGIYKTTNAGTTWTQVLTGNFKDLEIDPSNAAVWYAGRYGNGTAAIFKSTDTGGTWVQLTSGLPASGVYRVAIAVAPSSPSTLYALYCNNIANDYGLYGVYKTTNSGTTWTQVKGATSPNLLGWNSNGGDAGGQGWYDLCITVSPTDANNVYTGGVNIWRSTNGGTTWTINAHWTGSGASYAHADHHAVEFLPGSGTTLFSGNDGGFFKTTNNGTTWTDFSNGLGIHQYYRIGASKTNASIVLGGAQDNGTDRYNAGSWTRIIGGDGMECAVDFTNANIQYGALYYGDIYRTTSGGTPTNMADPSEDGAWVTPYVLNPLVNTTMYYATMTKVYRSTNVTNTTPTWSSISASALGTTSDPLTVLAVAPSNGTTMITANAANAWKGVFGGSTWTWTSLSGSGLPAGVTYVAFHPTDPNTIWATIGGFTAGSKVFKTVNGGTSWTNISTSLPNVPANCVAVHPTTPNDVYIGMDLGAFYSADGGTTWEAYDTGLPNVIVNELEIHVSAGKIRAATYGRGLWESPLQTTTPTNSVTVTAPNGGENLTAGTSTNITWTSTGTIANVKLEYSTDGGTNYTVIAASTANDGSQAWTVPSTATTQGRVRVSDVLNAATNDVSNANFTITVAPTNSVTVTAPNGGENLTGGNSTTITWTSTGTIANVKLEYSLDGGTNYTVISTSTANDGTEAWTVPSSATTQGRVRVSDALNAATNDVSNANFTITVPSGGYATLPYSFGFETALDAYWATSSSNSFGRILRTTANAPHSGSYHLTMDVTTNNNYSENHADLKVNLSGYTNATLSFWWKDFGDENHTNDGVYFSSNGGSTFTKVYTFLPASYSTVYTQFTLDIDALCASNGLTMTSTFVIRFQQYDNYVIATDGMSFDDISVTGTTGGPTPPITAESEDNGASTSADGPVGTGVAVSGSVSSTTDNDWYYFDVSTAGNVGVTLAITGSADLDWYMYNSALTEVARGYTVNNPETGNYTAGVGRYYVKVNGYSGATAAYTLTLSGGLAQVARGGQKGQVVPAKLTLDQNYPNPFNPTTSIRFGIPKESHVSLKIYNILGQEIRSLINENRKAGNYDQLWDGRNQFGAAVSSGIYIYRLQAGNEIITRKMNFLK